MNVSSIVVRAASKHVDSILEVVQNAEFCDYHFHDKDSGKIILTVEGKDVSEEIEKLKLIQNIPYVASADMMMSYSEDELDRERDKLQAVSNPVPNMLNDNDITAENIVYNGDLKKKDL